MCDKFLILLFLFKKKTTKPKKVTKNVHSDAHHFAVLLTIHSYTL